MGESTGIGWTDATMNFWIGCSEAGPGCALCYARELDRRYQWGVKERQPGVAPHWGPGAPRHRTSVSNWRGPVLWNAQAQTLGRPRKVFCNSLSDFFDNEVDQAWREDSYKIWRDTPWLRWQVVTKRIGNARKMLPRDFGPKTYPNVGLISTVVNQDEWDRDADKLLSIPARWHGFSMEPMLGPIRPALAQVRRQSGVWFITGGESNQPGVKDSAGHVIAPRPYDPEWIVLLQEVQEAAPNVRIFVKQTGAAPVGLPAPRDGAGANPLEWPTWMREQEFVPELLT